MCEGEETREGGGGRKGRERDRERGTERWKEKERKIVNIDINTHVITVHNSVEQNV